MLRVNVSSSDIASVGYDEESQTLEIQFNSGSIYDYFDVPSDVHEALMTASSHGKFFYKNIRERFNYEKVG